MCPCCALGELGCWAYRTMRGGSTRPGWMRLCGGLAGVKTGERGSNAFEESDVTILECVGLCVLHVEGADDRFVDDHRDDELGAGRLLVGEVSGVMRDVV